MSLCQGKPLALCGDSGELGVLEGRSQNFYDIPFPCLLVFLCSNILYFLQEGIYLPYVLGWERAWTAGTRLEPSIGLNSVTVLVHGVSMNRNSADPWLYNACSFSELGCPGPEMEPSNVCRNAESLPSCLPTKLHSSEKLPPPPPQLEQEWVIGF